VGINVAPPPPGPTLCQPYVSAVVSVLLIAVPQPVINKQTTVLSSQRPQVFLLTMLR
jgi:hypothetical protein